MSVLKIAAVLISVAATACFGVATACSAADSDWRLQTGDYANTRYSALAQINSENVGHLDVAWTFATGVLRGHQGAPLVVGDVMYVHTPFPNIVYALDLNSDGKLLWKFSPRQDANVIPVMCCDTANRGMAYADGKLFMELADTTVVALDARTGNLLWSVANGDPRRGEVNTASVLPVNGKLIVGISGGDFGVRCHVTAYDQATGKRMWRAYSEGPDEEIKVDPRKTTYLGKPIGPDSSISTWEGDQWKTGGGCTWGWYSYDARLNLFYYGSGNPSTWNPSQRPNSNKWTDTIWARDPDTGVAKWVYQLTPHDEWDFDGVNEMVLVERKVDGRDRDLLVHFDRNGFAYTLDRATGELLVAQKYDPTINWASAIEMDPQSPSYGKPIVLRHTESGSRKPVKGICPASIGTKDEQPASYSPITGLFYVPTNHFCMDYDPAGTSYTPGQPLTRAKVTMYAAAHDGSMGNFVAWDAVNGKIIWSKTEPFSVWSGSLATEGGVVFYGTLEGYLKAVDAGTGRELFKTKTPAGIVGNVMTYMHRGRQYVAVYSGVGSWAGIGLAAGSTSPGAGTNSFGNYDVLNKYAVVGGMVTTFALPQVK